ncbi:MAG: hypothetical protein Q9214_004453, partial [Letrouitia sp. 1 TL-2023]
LLLFDDTLAQLQAIKKSRNAALPVNLSKYSHFSALQGHVYVLPISCCLFI